MIGVKHANSFQRVDLHFCGAGDISASAALVLYEPFAYPVGDSLDGIDGAPVNAGGKTAPNGNKWFPAGYSTQTDFNALVGTQVVDLNLAVDGLQAADGQCRVVRRQRLYDAAGNGLGKQRDRLRLVRISDFRHHRVCRRLVELSPAFNNTPGPQTAQPTVSPVRCGCGRRPIRRTIPANYNIGLRKNPSHPPPCGTPAFTPPATTAPMQFAVTSYTFNSASTTDDTVSLYLNPNPSTFGGATPTSGTILSTSDGSDIAPGRSPRFYCGRRIRPLHRRGSSSTSCGSERRGPMSRRPKLRAAARRQAQCPAGQWQRRRSPISSHSLIRLPVGSDALPSVRAA